MKKILNLFTIRTSLLTIIGLLSILILYIVINSSITANQKQSAVELSQKANNVADHLLKAAGNWAVERGLSNANLSAENPVNSATKSNIEDRRRTADSALKAALEILKDDDIEFHNKSTVVGNVTNAFKAVEGLRVQVNRNLGLAKEQRSSDVIKNTVPTITKLIMSVRTLRTSVTNSSITQSKLSNLTLLKHFAWVASEYAGRERAVVGGKINSHATLDPASLQTLAKFRGRVEESWATMKELMQSEGLDDPRIVKAMENAERNYFIDFEKTRNEVYGAGVSNALFNITSSEWINEASTAIDSILELQTSISNQWKASGKAPQTNNITDRLLASTGTWAIERGVTNAALFSKDPINETILQSIRSKRESSDANYLTAIRTLKNGFSFKSKTDHIASLESQYLSIKSLRGEIDEMLEQPLDSRDLSLLKQWVPTLTKLIITTADTIVAAQTKAAFDDGQVNIYASLKHFAWVMSEYAGRERAVIGGLISSGKQITSEQFRTLSSHRGHVETARDEINTLLNYSDNVSDISTSFKSVQEKYFTDFEVIRQDVYVASQKSAAYPRTGGQWISEATSGINSLLSVQTAITDSMNDVSNETISESSFEFIWAITILLIAVTVAVMSFLLVVYWIVNPIDKMTNIMGVLSNGNYDVDVPSIDRSDEIGSMAGAVQIFKDSGIENKRLQEEVETARLAKEAQEAEARKAEQEADRKAAQEREEQERQIQEDRKAARNELADSFEKRVMGVMEGVSSAATELSATSSQMSSAATSTQEKSLQASSSTEQTSSNVQTVAAASEEMTASISEIGRQVTDAASVSSNAVSTASDAANRVNELQESAVNIGKIIELINDIAEQTNLLALNATIEAARAGEAGRGFAVVASEVKSLANQTANATNEISTQIQGMQVATEEAVESVSKITTTINQISDISTAIASAVEEQSASTQEISRNISEAANGTEVVGTAINEVNVLAMETGDASNSVNQASAELSIQAETLKGEVESFLHDVRTG